MAIIYNFMPETILVFPNTENENESDRGIPVESGQQSIDVEWPDVNIVYVWCPGYMDGSSLCRFDFGVHALIQGSNYAMIKPNSYLVYDSNHDVISTAV